MAVRDDGRDRRRRHDGADRGAGVDEAHRGGRSPDRKPFGDDFRRRGKAAAFAGAEEEPARGQHPHAGREAWLAQAIDQNTMMTRNPRRVPSRSMSTPPPAYISAYASRNTEFSSAELRVGEWNVLLDRGDGHRQRLPIEVADRNRRGHKKRHAPFHRHVDRQ